MEEACWGRGGGPCTVVRGQLLLDLGLGAAQGWVCQGSQKVAQMRLPGGSIPEHSVLNLQQADHLRGKSREALPSGF